GRQVCGHVGLLVVPHLDFERHGHDGNAAPFSGPAAPARIKSAYGYRTVDHQDATAAPMIFTVAGGHRNAGYLAYQRYGGPVVIPAARVFEPPDIAVLYQQSEFDGVALPKPLVGIDA